MISFKLPKIPVKLPKISDSLGFRASDAYLALAFVAFAVAVVYGFFQYQSLSAQEQAITDNRARLAMLSETVQKNNQQFKDFAAAQAKTQDELAKNVEKVLPIGENYTDLTRQFDDYFAEHDTAANPILQSSLRFGKGKAVTGMNGVSALPVSMNLEGTRKNFYDFLEFVNTSGSLDTGTRLMDLHSIQLNFADEGEDTKNPKQKINFTVDMNAYFRTPTGVKTK